MKFKQFFSIFFIFVLLFSVVGSVFVSAQAPPPPPPPPANQAPTLSGIPDQTLQEDSGLNDNIIDLFSYTNDDFDTDEQLTFSITSQSNTGVVSCSLDGDRYIDCTTQTNQNGFSDVTVSVTDTNSLTGADTFRITVSPVNDAPIADAKTVNTNEDTPVAIDLTGSDVDGNPLTYTVTSGPSSGALSGTAPSLKYKPNVNFNGADSFTFKVNDGTVDSSTATVSITVTAVNDAPIADAKTVNTNEDTPVAIDLTGSDVDGNPLTYTVTSGPSSGALSGTAPSLKYKPNVNFNGADSFTFKVN